MRAVLALLVACASPTLVVLPPLPPGPGVPLSVWSPPVRCESWLWEPATFCVRGHVHDFDGCTWRCIPAPIEGARQ